MTRDQHVTDTFANFVRNYNILSKWMNKFTPEF